MSFGTFHRPSELFTVLRNFSPSFGVYPSYGRLGFASLCRQLPNPLRILSKTQPAAEVIGDWLLVIGYWIWAAKPHIRTFTLYTLHFTLIPRAFTLYTLL